MPLPIIGMLASWGLGTLAKAAVTVAKDKAEDWIQEKTGVDISDGMDQEKATQLLQYQMVHEEELTRLANQREEVQETARTARHQADMSSDSWLSKNIRPLLAAGSLILAWWAITDVTVTEAKAEMAVDLATMVLTFYVVARTAGDKGALANITKAWKDN